MPELPDILVYIDALEAHVLGEKLEGIRVSSPFLLRTAVPPLEETFGQEIKQIRRIGKRIAFGLENDLWLVLHLMIAGRLQWKDAGAKPPGRTGQAAFDFSSGTMILTEAGSKKRASLHVLEDEKALEEHDPGGLEVLENDLAAFHEVLTSRNHTLKRALTDPRLFSGIGNAYSDEILHRAQLSPITWTSRLSPEEIERLYKATRASLEEWTATLRAEAKGSFPKKVTAFREDMAVHGRYKQPCPVCYTPVQRIRYATRETNYCPTCQTEGKLLADRALSRLLKKDWPRTMEELENLKKG
ncbi:MAG: formamidopyrimidine-DNA glycosylase [Chloroflexi bacterium]|nr:MAG: formamidopyrimidine-DNA glycosylase [Chloroflexota bacterium]MBL1194274.1 formamidopyrimidine-DNA glycosylase [Chloroflexota bacterium]NOH11564.1 formamidopyrimidine-DNA glycosylase [Chloroflexota bacterium]